jgi:RNA polymerase subunit RPABC4/transcription elongation factor Spt4
MDSLRLIAVFLPDEGDLMCAQTRRLKNKQARPSRDTSGNKRLTKGELLDRSFSAGPAKADSLAHGQPLGIEVECRRCGTVIQFVTGKCPICGSEIGAGFSGLAEFLAGSTFEDERCMEEACPACGELVRLETDICPACNEAVRNGENRVLPVEVGDNVVFIHLDVLTGEICCLRRMREEKGLEQVCLRLDSRDRLLQKPRGEEASEA